MAALQLFLSLAAVVAMSASEWSAPRTDLVAAPGRLAVGERVHLVGHLNGRLVHYASSDGGLSWGPLTDIAAAQSNYPMMYGGLAAQGSEVYLLTAAGNMASAPRALDVRVSSDHGATWTAPVRITSTGMTIWRARIVVSGRFVHVVGTANPTTDASVVYFRSVDRGLSWEAPRILADNLGTYGGSQTVAVDGATVHTAYTKTRNGVGAGDTMYIRSEDDGASWSTPVEIGEEGESSDRQARVQVAAGGGRVFACWQREADVSGDPVPADRIGYNRSDDGGLTWGTAQIFPGDTGVSRNHQLVCMTADGDVHVLWRHGTDGVDQLAGYLHSPDFGQSWGERELIAMTGTNSPYSIAADATAAHILVGPISGMIAYSRRGVPGSGNSAPVITAPASVTGQTPTTVDLAVEASDAEEDPLTYLWSASTQPAGASPTLPAGANTTVVFDRAGDYTLTVTVSDGRGGSTSSSIDVSVEQVGTNLQVDP